jgi:hypothetical protein
VLKKIIIYFTTIILIASCSSFYQPATLDLDIPDGPVEYKAGWRAGCRTALAMKVFANAVVYQPDFGTGIYQHDKVFQGAWSNGFYACASHVGGFVSFPSAKFGPLQ